MKAYFLLAISFILVALGHPNWAPFLGLPASFIGYALFWRFLEGRKELYLLPFLWYTAVGLVQNSWLCSSIKYQGGVILILYFGVSALMGGSFAVLTKQLFKHPLTNGRIAFLGSMWTFLEWARCSLVLCGFSFNPSGMALTTHMFSLQWASIIGVHGLSFLVILFNLVIYREMEENRRDSLLRQVALLARKSRFIVPLFVIGGFVLSLDRGKKVEKLPVNLALVQTALMPEEKLPSQQRMGQFIPLIVQWERIAHLLHENVDQNIDVLLVSECAVPMSARNPIYSLSEADQKLVAVFGEEIRAAYPPRLPPFFEKFGKKYFVSNSFFLQTFANHYNAELIAGQEDSNGNRMYQTALHFKPFQQNVPRGYAKQKLVPGEYLPLELFRSIASRYGIVAFFERGTEAKMMGEKVRFSPTICYDELFSELVREGSEKGAEVLLNLTNDNWYPNSKLPEQHYAHAKVRAVENGRFLVRVCNTGVTAVVDPQGREVARFAKGDNKFQHRAGVLSYLLSPRIKKTVYSLWGDGIVASIIVLFLLRRRVDG